MLGVMKSEKSKDVTLGAGLGIVIVAPFAAV